MGRKGKYASRSSRQETKKFEMFCGIIFGACILVYVTIVRDFITNFQWNIFCGPNTMLLLNTSPWMTLIDIFCGSFLLTSVILVLYCYIKDNKLCVTYGIAIKKYNKYAKEYLVIIIITLVIGSIIFFSYCRFEKDGLYVRDIRTFFIERKFSWSEVESVKIEYTTNIRSKNIRYLISFDNFKIDAKDSWFTSKREMVDQGMKELHSKIKDNSIPIDKEIEIYDDKIKDFFYIIGEG